MARLRSEPLVLRGHEDRVWGVAMEGGVVVSASRDRTLRVWDVEAIRGSHAKGEAGPEIGRASCRERVLPGV